MAKFKKLGQGPFNKIQNVSDTVAHVDTVLADAMRDSEKIHDNIDKIEKDLEKEVKKSKIASGTFKSNTEPLDKLDESLFLEDVEDDVAEDLFIDKFKGFSVVDPLNSIVELKDYGKMWTIIDKNNGTYNVVILSDTYSNKIEKAVAEADRLIGTLEDFVEDQIEFENAGEPVKKYIRKNGNDFITAKVIVPMTYTSQDFSGYDDAGSKLIDTKKGKIVDLWARIYNEFARYLATNGAGVVREVLMDAEDRYENVYVANDNDIKVVVKDDKSVGGVATPEDFENVRKVVDYYSDYGVTMEEPVKIKNGYEVIVKIPEEEL